MVKSEIDEERAAIIERNTSLLRQLGFESSLRAIKKQKKMPQQTRKSARIKEKISYKEDSFTTRPSPQPSPQRKKYTYVSRSARRQQQEPIGSVVQQNGRRSSARLLGKKIDYSEIDNTLIVPEAVVEEEEELAPSSSSKFIVMFTGISDPQKYYFVVQRLGGEIEEEDITRVSHLVTNSIKRTVKFMCGICIVPNIMSLNWIRKSDKNGYFVDESKFLLRDEKSEKKLGFSLSESIEKAKLKKVFAGKKFFLTQQIVPPPKELEQVIRCGGGEVLNILPKSFDDLFVISCDKDLEFCKNELKDVPKERFHETEFVISSVFKQELDEKAYLLQF